MSDPNAQAVAAKVLKRSEAGIRKYGVGTDRTDLSLREWLVHFQEELLDGAVYVERILRETLPGEVLEAAAPAPRPATPRAGPRGFHGRDRSGERYGALTIIELGTRTPGGAIRWLCRCDCGREQQVQLSNLNHPKWPKRDCGCGAGRGKTPAQPEPAAVTPAPAPDPAPKQDPPPASPPKPEELAQEVPPGKVDLVYDLAARGVRATQIAERLQVTVDAVEALLTDDEDAA